MDGGHLAHHDLKLVAAAAAICIFGAALTARSLLRLTQPNPTTYWLQLSLSGLIGGGTIWATHFIAMLSFDPGVPHGYAPASTLASLAIAIIGATVTFQLASNADLPRRSLVSGTVFGLTISAMHYLGMYAIPGQFKRCLPTKHYFFWSLYQQYGTTARGGWKRQVQLDRRRRRIRPCDMHNAFFGHDRLFRCL